MIKKIYGLLSFVLIAMAFSCSSDSDEPNYNPVTSSSISASVGGQSWASMTGGAVASVSQVEVMGESMTMLQIVGMKMDQSTVTVQFPITNLSEGTYTFNSDGEGLLSYSTPGGSNSYTSMEDGGSFNIHITDVNVTAGTISGTFSGTLFDFDGNSMSITNGAINSVSIMSNDLYSNGSMWITRNAGAPFLMDDNHLDGKYLMISQNSMSSSLSLLGYNTNSLSTDFGIYNLNLPLDATTGTHSLTSGQGYSAGIGNAENEAEYTVTSGSVNISSHNGNVLAGTFTFTATNGTNTVTVSNGNFNITHH